MTTRKETNSRDDYIAIDRAMYVVSGRYCPDDPLCTEPDDPDYNVGIHWFCWREESDAAGRYSDTRASVVVLLDSRRRHASGSATLLFKAGRLDFGDTPTGLITGSESLAVASGWIEAGGLRVQSTRAGTSEEGGCAVAEVSDDVAIALLQNIAQGSLPAISLHFVGEPCGRVFQIMKPIDGDKGSLIGAQINIVKQILPARSHPTNVIHHAFARRI